MHVKFIIFSLIIATTFGGCAYEDGPFSLRSRARRLANTWEYERVLENGVEITDIFKSRTVEFDLDGELIFTIFGLNGEPTILQGSWDWGNHQDRIIIQVFDTNTEEDFFIEWIIRRLSKDELHVDEFTDGKIFRSDLRTKQ